MKMVFFLLIPHHQDRESYIFTIPERQFSKTLSGLAPHIGEEMDKGQYICFERFRCRRGPLGKMTHAWVDENGHRRGKRINFRVSNRLYPGLLAGNVALQLGTFDLDKAGVRVEFEKMQADLALRLKDWGLTFDPYI